MPEVRDRFRELRDAPSPTPDDLDALWADLAPVDVPDILGHWTGGDFATGHVVSTVLTKSRWHGKWFDSPLEVTPIVCRDEAGQLVANEKAAGGGGASLWNLEFRGEVTATMVYDRLPVFDHFKAVDENTLMGIMNGKLQSTYGISDLYYFWLERE
ncbi:hypothetical protein BJ980_001208 [Nocardioides daedukensis]|uniref:DUF4334 domain-containing protein n=1 Tax=Nocardioides daedukensis TaxID=634462 RepID=A0A7Y9RXX5_9ACTN|nr:DUF4334 domain-containing protein [Nocardioides daedukensis]NYG58285.1 hypothetical protein [Nocardioides daedukensis]